MSKETTKKRSQSAKTKAKPKTSAKAKARKRQKQKLIITGVLAVILLVVSVIAIFVLGGFGGKKATENSVYILEDNKILTTTIEAFDENSLDKDELKAYMRETIKAYNKENGSTLVRQKSFKLKDGVAALTIQYENADVFEEFFGTELFVGTIAEAMAEGYTFEDVSFASVGRTVKEASSEDFITDDTYKVAIIRANTKVLVEGTISYISTENIAEVGSDYIVTKEGAVLEVESVDSTEAEAVDGAVSDDDLLSEEGGMVYDFGEEDVPVRDYTEVYTYIIYK